MPLYRHEGRVVFFVHVPKTGGTAVERALVAAGAVEALAKKHATFSISPHHMHADVHSAWLPPAFTDYAFTVVRNPYNRLFSEYRWRTAGRSGYSFDHWVWSILHGSRRNPDFLDNHLRKQSDFLAPHVSVFKLEEGLAAPVQAALTHLGLSRDSSAIPVVNSTRPEIPVAYEATIDLIRSHYACDFETLGYSDVPPPEATILPTPSLFPHRRHLARLKVLAKRAGRRLSPISGRLRAEGR